MDKNWIDKLADSLTENFQLAAGSARFYIRREEKMRYSGVEYYFSFERVREATKPLTTDQWQELSDVTHRMGYPVSTANEVFTAYNFDMRRAEAGALAELGARVGLIVELKRRLDSMANGVDMLRRESEELRIIEGR